MAEVMSMDDILTDKKPEPREPAAEPTEPAAGAEPSEERPDRPSSLRKQHREKELTAQGRDPSTGQFVKKAESEAPAAAPAAAEAPKPEAAKPAEQPKLEPEKPAQEEMTPKEKAAFAAAADERRKRQALEQQLAQLRQGAPAGQPASQPAGAAQPEKKAFWDDPEGYFKAQEESARTRELNTVLRTSEYIARSRHQDFDEKIEKFSELVQSTPGLAQQWLGSPDPAEFAYRTGKNHLELAQAGSLDKIKAEVEAKARADERAKIEAEYKAKDAEREKQRAALPGSLSDVHGAAPRKQDPVFAGPTPMSEIIGR